VTSLIGFEHSTNAVKRLPVPLITPQHMQDRLKICEEDAADIRQMQAHLRTAVSMLEKQTGIVVSPRLVEMRFDKFPDREIPLPFEPVWDDEQLKRYHKMYCDCGTVDERCFAKCLPECAVSIETWSKKCRKYKSLSRSKYFLDNKRKPNALKLENCCSCWPCDPCGRPVKVTFVLGYGCLGQIENEVPELLDAIVLLATDLFDCRSMDEIRKRQGPFWSMLGHAC